MDTELSSPKQSLESLFEQFTAPDPKRRGVLHATRVRFTSFVVISLSLFAASVQCILAVWNYVGEDTAWRSLATLGIVAATMVVFTILNEMFGSMIGD
jgi:hypothetical protein